MCYVCLSTPDLMQHGVLNQQPVGDALGQVLRHTLSTSPQMLSFPTQREWYCLSSYESLWLEGL